MRSTTRPDQAGWRLPAIGLCLALLAACAAPGAPGTEHSESEPAPEAEAEAHGQASCKGFPQERPFTIAWAEHGDEGTVRTGSRLRLALTNDTDQAIDAEITLRVRADGELLETSLGVESVGPRSTKVVAADLPSSGLRLQDLTYSAQVAAVARLSSAGERLAGAPSTEHLFFHVEPGTGALLVYGERAYLEKFRAGDFRGLRVAREGEAAVSGHGVGRLARPDELKGDPMDGR
jgi:hypothetical protein